MKRSLAILTIGLALASGRVFAREPQSPPFPAVDGASTRAGRIRTVPHPRGYGEISLFVGKYGQTIEIPYYWSAFVESRGQAETVYFHRKFSDDHSRVPFQPKPSDYKLENFSRLELMELVVIPKTAPGGLRSLKAIRQAKKAELARDGIQFRIAEEKNQFAWPRGTFYVEILSPYRIFQTYSESPSEFYILTVGDGFAAGHGEKRASDYDYAAERALESLRKHLLSVQKKAGGPFWFKPESPPSGGFLADFKQFRLGASAALLTAVMIFLSIWPGTSPTAGRARLFGRSLLFFTSFAALTGFLSVYIPVRFFGAIWRNSSAAELIPILSFPLVSWIVAVRFGSVHPRRVFFWTLILAALFTLDLYQGIRFDEAIPPGEMAYEATLFLYVLGLAFGLVSALAFGPAPQRKVHGMKRALIAALFLFPAGAEAGDPHAELAAEMYEIDPEVRRATLEVLRRKNAYYEQDALDNLAKKGEVFTYARVEVTGVMSNDNTAEYDEFLFEKYIKPSFSVRQSGLRGLLGGPINEVLKKLFPPIKTGEILHDASLDIQEFSAAAAGVTTDRAREKLAPYRGAEINELVAHSWGTELIYAAILNGEIRPPKRLIVVGVPDNDRSKWDMLAARTGTEVIWARADNDAVVLDAGMELALRAAAEV